MRGIFKTCWPACKSPLLAYDEGDSTYRKQSGSSSSLPRRPTRLPSIQSVPPLAGPSIVLGTPSAVSHQCVHHAFSAQAVASPDHVAVVDHTDQSVTYGELNELSARLADSLRSRGVKKGSRVCLLVERSISQVIGILAVLRAGAAYVPLDGGIITDHLLSSVLQDAEPAFTLISRCYMDRSKQISSTSGCLEDMISESKSCSSKSNLQHSDETCPSDSAYVIYTSGTTGQPKGVIVSHINLTNLLCQYPGNLGINPGVRVAQLLNVAFDMCVWEILGCLMNGGTLYLRGPHRPDWLKVMRIVDVIICTPSILVPHDPSDYPNLRVVATAGESCPQLLADRWAQHVKFFNCCGPTEVTIVNTMHLHVPGTPITIGKPTPNNNIYILDDNLSPVPQGQVGVIWAGGLGVSQGYLGRKSLNESKFKNDLFSTQRGKMYNTGDIGVLREDGEVEHLGRIDDQVKIKGFRVELDGVSAAMCRCPGVVSACALLIGQDLWGFFCPEHVSAEEVNRTVIELQPSYAVPRQYRGIHSMPLTSNGKIDKRLLRQLVEPTAGC